MGRKINANRKLLLGYYLFLAIGLFLLLIYSKTEIFNLLHFRGNEITDLLFRGITFLGDGLFAFAFALLAGFKKIRYALYFLIISSFSGIVVQLLKRLVFPDALRPLKYFEEMGQSLQAIAGYDNHFFYSFPSGHTATAFAIFFGLAYMIRKEYLKYLLLAVAIIIGYSRVYLLQHFPEDVLAGSLIAVLSVILFYPIVFSWKKSWFAVSYMELIRKKNVE